MQVVQLQGFFLKLKREQKVATSSMLRDGTQHNRLRSERMAHALMDNRGRDFWSEIGRINSNPTSVPPSVDGITGNKPIADDWASLFESVFNIGNKSARDTLSTHLSQATSLSDLRDIVITPDVIRDSIAHLKRGKSDGVGLSSATDHVINASIPLEQFLAPIFTACFHHGHVPAAF